MKTTGLSRGGFFRGRHVAKLACWLAWGVACHAAEPPPAGLIGRWDFDAITGGIVRDRSGRGRHGQVHGAPISVPGVAGQALRFQSNNDYVDFGAPIIPTGDFTISLWLNCDDVTKQFFLGQYRYNDPRRLDLAVREGAVRIQIKDIIDSPKLAEPKRWFHLAYTRAGADVVIYFNGKPVMRGHTAVEPIQTENLLLGKIIVPGQDSFRLTGAVDELEVWDRARSPDEIAASVARVGRLEPKSRQETPQR